MDEAAHHDWAATRRRARRITLRWLLPIFGILIILMILAVWAFSTEAFWRRYIIPRYVGPYWETVVDWESFSPQVFPPSLKVRNLTLREPGADGEVVLTINEMNVGITLSTRSDNIDLRQLHVSGIDIDLVMYGEEDSNLSRAIDRLYDGMSPRAGLPDRAVVPRIYVRDLKLDDLRFRFTDHRYEGIETVLDYRVVGSVHAVVNEFSEVFEPGRLDNFLRLRMTGLLRARVNEWEMESRTDLVATAEDLGSYPRNVFSMHTVLHPMESKGFEVMASVDFPADRIPIRPIATQLKNISLEARRVGEKSFFAISDSSFDPLHGALKVAFALDGTWKDVTGAARAYLSPETGQELQDYLEGQEWHETLMNDGEPLSLIASGFAEGQGIGQYAIADPSELLPLSLQTEGNVEVRGFPLAGLETPRKVADRDLDPEARERSFPADVGYLWRFTAEERQQFGTMWMRMQAVPSETEGEDMMLTITLADAEDEGEPVRFNPFAADLMHALKMAFEQQQQEAPPVYTLFAAYEEILLSISRQMTTAFDILDAANMEDAALRHHFLVNDGPTMELLAEPVIGQLGGAHSGEVNFTVSRPGRGRPSIWSGDFHVAGMRMPEVEGTIDLEASAELLRDGDIMTARELLFTLTRSGPQYEEPVALRLFLPRVGRDGEDGPVRPSFLNFATGEGFFQLRADKINREIMEVLLRIQTFGLSDQLAQPIYQRMLDMFGFRPGDPTAVGQAAAHLAMDLGAVMKVSTLVDVRNVPAANFLFLPAEDDALMESFDIMLAQTTRLDRRTELLHPDEFDLTLLTPGSGTPFAMLHLDAGENAAFSFPDLQRLAELETESLTDTEVPQEQSLREFILAFFERVERVREALRSGTGRIIITLPNVDLGELRNTIQAAGFPIDGGRLDLRLETGLHQAEEEVGSSAHGTFKLTDLKLVGAEEIFPVSFGTLHLQHEGKYLHLRDLSTSFKLDEDYDATELSFIASFDTETLDSKWTLMLEGINTAVLNALQRIRTSGVAGAVTVLENLPLQSLATVAGQEGKVNLRFDAETLGAEGTGRLVATQTGQNLIVLPGLFEPFSFELSQTIFHHGPDAFTLEALEGRLDEEGASAPVLALSLTAPLDFGEGITRGDEDAILTLRVEKNLSEISERLVDFPLPLYQRPISGGMISGEMEIVFPEGQFVPDEKRQEVTNYFFMDLEGLQLVGYPQRFDGRLSGTFRKVPGLWSLEDVRLETQVGDQPTGTLMMDGFFDGEHAHAVVDLVDFRSLLLDALPHRFNVWTKQPGSTLNLRTVVNVDAEMEQGTVDFISRVRSFGLPSLPLPDGSFFTHPPLHLDVQSSSDFSSAGESVVVRDTKLVLTKGEELPPSGRLDPLPEGMDRLLDVTQNGTIVYRQETTSFDPATEEGAGLHAVLGPVDLAEYGAVLYQALGLPLTEGTWTGEASVEAIGSGATRLNRLDSFMNLENATWESSNGFSQNFDAEMRFSADVLRNVVRLTQLTMRANYPDEERPVDHLTLGGFYEYGPQQDEVHNAELNVDSDAMALDRLLRFISDHLDARERLRAPLLLKDEEALRPHEIARQHIVAIPDDLVAVLTGQLRNVTFRDLSFPRTSVRALYEEGSLTLHEFRSRLEQGEIALSGEVELAEKKTPWSMTGRINRLQARPWVNSFASENLRDSVSGTVNADMNLQGSGFDEEDWRSVQGRMAVSLQEGLIEQLGLGTVLGSEANLAADLDMVLRGNRLLFTMKTPWNPARDVTVRGMIRDFFPQEGRDPHLRAVADFKRTSTVGPQERTMEYKGETVPYRQMLFGMIVELIGYLGEDEDPMYKLRTIRY